MISPEKTRGRRNLNRERHSLNACTGQLQLTWLRTFYKHLLRGKAMRVQGTRAIDSIHAGISAVRSLSALLVVSAAFFLFSQHQLYGQAPSSQSIADEPACASCAISVQHLVALGGSRDSVAVYGFPHELVRSSRFDLYMIPRPSNHILRYDSSGVLTQIIGRSGEGPGEFLAASQLAIVPGDTLLVADDFARRMSLFAPDGEFARQFTLHASVTGSTVTRLADGRFITAGVSQDPARIGFPIHTYRPNGSFERSFGTERPVHDPFNVDASRRYLAVDDSLLLLVRPDRYVIEIRSLDGQLLKTLERKANWFPPRDRISPGGSWGATPPDSWIKGLQVDSLGQLWVAAVRARRDWRPHEHEYESGRLREYYESVIEVIDVTSGRIVTRTVVPEYVHGFAGPNTIYSHREDERGGIEYHIWLVAMTRENSTSEM